ncbi:CNNM domain-containing protein [Pontiella agarivorans]|uniref:CNNM domain-containing protein n=1 Tax=Pontiella agarivorans TaxID=3038953 RepID=A0ABU5MSD4_9BACT|nr:CNNM domain-containing protein [Pontiella agarivorans]MDZ8117105.1 CNNM domain-containing protein [Pontiella agarivorans]
MISTVTVILLGFAFSALFSGVETGSYTINRIRLERRVRERKTSAVILQNMLAQSHIFIFTVLIGNNLAVYLLSAAVTDLYISSGVSSGNLLLGFIPWNAETAATLTLMFPLFLFAEVGPKNLFRKKADVLMYRFAGLMKLLVWGFYPFTWPLKKIFSLLTHGSKDAGRDLHRLSPDALKEYFSTSEREGVISSEQSRMMDNATTMHSIPVRMLMSPIKKVPALQDSATVGDFKRLVARRETTEAILMHRHMAVGMITMFSLINRNLEDDEPLKPYADDLLYIEENRNLKSAFYRLRKHPRHRAVVTDARGHPVGFIRLEDIARYIVKK